MRKDNQTPIHSSSGYLSICEPPDIRLRVTDNKCMSSSDYCEYLKVDTSTTYIFLASSVPCISLSHLESWRILRRCIQTLGMIHSVIISLLIFFLKTADIPTYKAFP